MPGKNTVTIGFTHEQVSELADWLAREYLPDPEQPAKWRDEQRGIARELAAKLYKAARRKRTTQSFDLCLPCDQAQWLATFVKPSGWWEFGDSCRLPAQQAPENIVTLAKLALRAVSRRKGRPLLTLLDTVDRIERCERAGADSRVKRRLRNETKSDREWEANEIKEAGPEPED